MGSLNRMGPGEDRKLDSITGRLGALFEGAGREEDFPAIDDRLRLPGLASDYRVNYDAAHALRRLTEGEHGTGTQESAHALLHDLNRWTLARRNALHEEEVTRLHHQALADGARLLLLGDETTTELLDKMANGDRLVQGAMQVVNSEIWGTIDLNRLNGGLEAYPGGIGQIELARDLSVLTGRLNIQIQAFPPLAKDRGRSRQLGWNRMGTEWRRMARIMAVVKDGSGYRGKEGYFRFAREFAKGDMESAYKFVSAILGKDFPALQWGKAVLLHVDDYPLVEKALKKPSEVLGKKYKYEGREGYKQFTRDYERFTNGDMFRAFQLASAILGNEFLERNWGREVNLHVDDYEKIEQALKERSEDGKRYKYEGQEGYAQFTRDFAHLTKGDIKKACHMASAILEDEFPKRKWGNQIYLHLDDFERAKTGLIRGEYREASGFEKFHAAFFTGRPFSPAWQTGSAMLGYADREWRKKIGWPSHYEIQQMDRNAGRQKIGSGRRATSGGRQKRFHPNAPALRRPSFRSAFPFQSRSRTLSPFPLPRHTSSLQRHPLHARMRAR